MFTCNHVFTLLAIENALLSVALVAGLMSRNLQITISSLIMCLSRLATFVTAFKISPVISMRINVKIVTVTNNGLVF